MKIMKSNKIKKILSLVCILCIVMMSFSFADNEKKDAKVIDKMSKTLDVSVYFPNGIILNKASIIEVQNNSGDKLVLDIPREIKLSKSKSKEIKLKKNGVLKDRIIIEKSGKYVININSADGLSKKFYINISEVGTFYGENQEINEVNFSNVVSSRTEVIDTGQVSVDKIDTNNKLSDIYFGESLRSNVLSADATISHVKIETMNIDTKVTTPKVKEKIFFGEDLGNSIPVESDKSKGIIARAVGQTVFVTADSVTCSSPEPYLINNQYPVVCTYTNYEYSTANSVPIKISINGNTQYSTIKSVNARSRHTLTLQLTSANANTNNILLEVGEEHLKSTARKSMLISESIGKNLEYYVLDTPNQVAPYDARTQITLRSFLQNTGTVDTGIIPFDVYFDDVKFGTYEVRSMTPGEKLNVNFNFMNNIEGNHTVRIVMDPNHTITSKNLEKSLSVLWNGTGPDLIVSKHTDESGGSGTINEIVNFNCSISNIGTKSVGSDIIGDLEARNITTGRRITIGNYTVSGLNVDEVVNFNYSKTFTETGNWIVESEIDSTNNVSESNENNNIRDLGISIIPTSTNYEVTWFSKLAPNFNVQRLNTLFFPNAGTTETSRTPFEWNDFAHGAPVSPYDGETWNRGILNKHGCVASALASVLNTLELTTTSPQYDFRTDSIDILSADPVSVVWANIGFPVKGDFTYNEGYDTWEMGGYDKNPTLIYRSRVAEDFGVFVDRTELHDYTDEEKQLELDALLALHPEGVIVRFTENGQPGNGHSIVFIKKEVESRAGKAKISEVSKPSIKSVRLTPEIEQDYFDNMNTKVEINMVENRGTVIAIPDQYIVSENATTLASKGDYVPYSVTWCQSEYPNFSNISCIDVVKDK